MPFLQSGLYWNEAAPIFFQGRKEQLEKGRSFTTHAQFPLGGAPPPSLTLSEVWLLDSPVMKSWRTSGPTLGTW